MTDDRSQGPIRLPAAVEGRLAEIGPLDVVVGVISFQNGHTIEGVMRSLGKALRAAFPDVRPLVVHSDAGSTDDTNEAAARGAEGVPLLQRRHRVPTGQRATLSAQGIAGAADGVRMLGAIARAAGARGVLLVGADLRHVPEPWIERLLGSVLADEADMVVPIYARHVLEGALTSWLLYPLVRALYGRAVRQPMTAELALSGGFLANLADRPAWSTPAAKAVPLLLTTTAAATGGRLAEAWLGVRDAEPPDSRADLGGLVSEVVGGTFALAELYEDEWREPRAGAPPRVLGTPIAAPGPPAAVSPTRMVAMFRQGLRDLVPIWEQALRPETLADLYPLGDLDPETFRFSPELWARVVYDFLLAHRFRVLHREHLLRSLVPLYLGRVAALAGELATGPPSRAERQLELQVRAFEEAKSDLLDRWR
jgi:glucosylglycerate synthase